MNILMSGSSGLIGNALLDRLSSSGNKVAILNRRSVLNIGTSVSNASPEAKEVDRIIWEPQNLYIDMKGLEDFIAQNGPVQTVIHLGGEGIATKRWTKAQKDNILKSRVESTLFLAKLATTLSVIPETFICASATGYYGCRGNEELSENSSSGEGFLAEVCRNWEASTEVAKEKGIRVVNLRTSIVLSLAGGALAKIVPLFKFGLGGKLGSGKQWMSWITLEDEIRAIEFAIFNIELEGPVNICSPNPITNSNYVSDIAKYLHRPHIVSAPEFGLKTILGSEFASEMLLCSQKVIPQKLIDSKFEFRSPKIENAFDSIFQK